MPRSLIPILFVLACSAAQAQTPYLVKDIHPGEDPARELVPLFLTRAGDLVFFWGESPAEGQEVWRSDGTPAGTFLLRDIQPGPDTSDPNGSDDNLLAGVGDLLFFVANDGEYSGELWRSDGTPEGTFQVTDIIPGPGGPGAENLTPAGDLLFFVVWGDSGAELWRSEGTSEGTFRIELGEEVSGFGGMTDLGGTLLFFAWDASGSQDLWKSDGTEAGTVKVLDGPASWQSLGGRAVVGGLLFFEVWTGTAHELWKTDGTAAGTVRVKAFDPGTGGPGELTAAGSLLFFRREDPAAGAELWRSDGTAAGTVRVKDIRPGAAGSFPNKMTAVGSTLYFLADDGTTGFELWKSNGTAAGTKLVKDLTPGAESSFLFGRAAAGGLFFFGVYDPEMGELFPWRSDGTAAGTFRLTDAALDSGSTFEELRLTPVGDIVYFSGNDPSHGRELWRSDGTEAGTWEVTDQVAGNSSRLEELVDRGGTLFFRAETQFSGLCELWRSDGTEAGTVAVPDAVTGAAVCPAELTPAAGTLFFHDRSSPARLWKTDGTAAFLVDDGTGGFTGVGELASLRTASGSVLLFHACKAATGCELWRSDGTSAGTALVADLAPGPASSALQDLTPASGLVFFLSANGPSLDLWRSNGTAAGTFALRERGDRPRGLTEVGVYVYFLVPGTNGDDIWRSDGTRAGTIRVFLGYGGGQIDKLTAAGGSLFFFVHRPEGIDLWRDGLRLATFPPDRWSPEALGTAGGLFFSISDPVAGRELWVSDGTEAGTRRVRDIFPGPGSSDPQFLADAFGQAVFAASDGVHGQEVWRSDGTTAGTVQLPDIAPGGSSSSPQSFTVSGPRVFFSADDGASGRELWAFSFDPNGSFVTGSGWFSTSQGKASFQLQARYKKGVEAPEGSLRFRLPGLDLQSQSLRWLVVRGAAAWIEGEGRVNGQGSYRFRAAVIDGQAAGGGGADRFRVRIQNASNGGLIYDSEPAAPDDALPTAALGGGSIQLHLAQKPK
jgi:ELWxxDGT repeat protein